MPKTSTIPAVVEAYSPAMLALDPRARAFVGYMVETGGNALRSALMAGAGQDSETADQRNNAARSAAWRWQRNPKVLLALKEQADATLRAGAIEAASYMRTLVTNEKAKDNDRLRAANRLLEMAGLGTVAQVQVDHRVRLSREQGIEQVMALAPKLGLDPRQLLGNIGITIDAEFEEVPDIAVTWEEEPDVDETW